MMDLTGGGLPPPAAMTTWGETMRSAPSPRAACLSLVCACAALVAVSPVASAATYHVAPTGSGSAAGTSALPFHTISRAASAARRGDTVLVESGRYPETVTVGSTGSGVTFRGQGPTRPVIDGEGKRAIGLTTNAHDVTVENFEISGQTQFGLYMRGKSNRVAGNLVHHIGAMAVNAASGIRVANGGGSVIADNTVHDVGPGGESMGIYLLQVRDTVVKGNTVYLVRKEGVRDFRGLDNTIRDNRLYLTWTGVSLNYSTGSTVVNNHIYDSTEGIDAKHDSYASVLSIWQLATPHWDRIWHNTIYRSTGISIGIGLGGDPFDYLDVRDNIF